MLIIGGGVAGATTALALEKAGHRDITLVEKFVSIPRESHFVNIRPAVVKKAKEQLGIDLEPLHGAGSRPDGAALSVKRNLVAAAFGTALEHTQVRWGVQFHRLADGGVRLKDVHSGIITSPEFDVVVFADGTGSKGRRFLTGRNDFVSYNGFVMCQGTGDRQHDDPEHTSLSQKGGVLIRKPDLATGRWAFSFKFKLPAHGHADAFGSGKLAAYLPFDSLHSKSLAWIHENADKLLSPIDARLVRSSTDLSVVSALDSPPADQMVYSLRPRLAVLVGDAYWSPLPTSASGANSAISHGIDLGESIPLSNDPDELLRGALRHEDHWAKQGTSAVRLGRSVAEDIFRPGRDFARKNGLSYNKEWGFTTPPDFSLDASRGL